MQFSRSQIGRFQCPNCQSLLPYGPTRKFIFAVIDEGKTSKYPCPACGQDMNVRVPQEASVKKAKMIWGVGSVATVLLALVAFGILRYALPMVPEWVVAVLALVGGLAPLPYIEAASSRHLASFHIVRRRS